MVGSRHGKKGGMQILRFDRNTHTRHTCEQVSEAMAISLLGRSPRGKPSMFPTRFGSCQRCSRWHHRRCYRRHRPCLRRRHRSGCTPLIPRRTIGPTGSPCLTTKTTRGKKNNKENHVNRTHMGERTPYLTRIHFENTQERKGEVEE